MSMIDLNERQRSLVAAALTMLSLVAIVVAGLWFVRGLVRFLDTFSGVLLPLATGAILALILRPYYDWLFRHTGRRKVVALVLVFATLLAPLAAFSWFFGGVLWEQLKDLVAAVPGWFESGRAWLESQWPDLQPLLAKQRDLLIQALQAVGLSALDAGVSLFNAVTGMLGWFVLPVYLIFFLMAPPMDIGKLERVLPFMKESSRKDVVFLAGQFVDILVSFFRGQLVIALIQGLLYAVAFSLVGLRFGFVLGLMLGLLNIVPYLGSIIGLSVCLPLAYFQEGGGLLTAVLVAVAFSAVQLVESYLLTPKIMGDRTGLHPLAIIVAIFFWGTALSGVAGMLLAIPLTAFLVVFWRLAREKYIREWI